MSIDLVSWVNVKARLKLEDSQQSEAEGLITVASQRANQYTNRILAAHDSTIVIDGSGKKRIFLPDYPINSITSVRIDGERNFEEESSVSDYFIDEILGCLIRNKYWPEGLRNIQVVGNFGFVTVPEDLEESIIQLVGYWLQSPQISWLGSGDAAGGGYQTQYVGVMDLPFQVRNVWDYYRAVIV